MDKDRSQTAWLKSKRIKKRRRRRIKIFRMLLILLIISLFSWLGLQVYDWASRTYNTYYESFQDYEKRKAERKLSIDERFTGYTNVLLIGIDEGTTGVPGQHADALILLSLNHSTGKLQALSIPRGTVVMIPGQTVTQRLNYAYTLGGPQLLTQATALFLGVSIHQYIVIDTKAMTEIIDTLGGLDIYVETNMNYDDPEIDLSIHLPQGFQHLDGKQAQHYLRFRSDELGDVGRVHRQQKFIKAFYHKLLSLDAVTKVPQIVDIMQKRFTTSAEIFDSAHLIKVIKGLSGEPPQTVLLPGVTYKDDDTLWITDPQEIQAKMAELFPEAVNGKK